MNPDLAWFEPPHLVTDDDSEPMRPVSLASMLALELLGITLLRDPPPDMDHREEMRQIRVFHWLHTAPIPEVKAAVWSGAARVAFDAERPVEAVIAWWRAHLDPIRRLLAECRVEIQPKPHERRRAEPPPADLRRPTMMSVQVLAIAERSGLQPEEVAWMPAAQALQLWHAACWQEGAWTIRPRERGDVSPAAFENFDPLTPAAP